MRVNWHRVLLLGQIKSIFWDQKNHSVFVFKLLNPTWAGSDVAAGGARGAFAPASVPIILYIFRKLFFQLYCFKNFLVTQVEEFFDLSWHKKQTFIHLKWTVLKYLWIQKFKNSIEHLGKMLSKTYKLKNWKRTQSLLWYISSENKNKMFLIYLLPINNFLYISMHFPAI